MSDVTQTVRDINELTPLAQTACRLFLDACKQAGLSIFLTETYRSRERQEYLYSLGRTRPGNKVTWTKNSRHISRRAWDIACSPPNNLYDETILKKAGAIAQSLGITWGGIWSTPDTPHFEISEDWKVPETEGGIDMEALAKLEARVDELEKKVHELENPIIYNYVDKNMPDWARNTVQSLLDKGYLKGNEKGELGLNYDMLRILAILDRANAFK